MWDHGSKDINGLGGLKVATGQYIFSCQTSVNPRECMFSLLVFEVNSR